MLKHAFRSACERKRAKITRRTSVSLTYIRRGSKFTMDTGALEKRQMTIQTTSIDDDFIVLRKSRGRLPSLSWHGPPPTIPASPGSPGSDYDMVNGLCIILKCIKLLKLISN